MRRFSRSAALAPASGILLAGWVSPAQADPVGGVIVIPGSSNDLVAISVVVVILTVVVVVVANRLVKGDCS